MFSKQRSRTPAKTSANPNPTKSNEDLSTKKLSTTRNQIQEESTPFSDIDRLEKSGISKADISTLREGGFLTVESIARASRKDLLKVKGISNTKAGKIFSEATKLTSIGFTSAIVVHQKRADIIQIETGSRALNRLLGGGIETGSITEIFGEARTGKSPLCHTIAVICQLPVNLGGAEGKCLWIDSEETFRPYSLPTIARRFKLDPNDVLKNIAYVKCRDTKHRMDLLSQAAAMMTENRYALVIVDSVLELYRKEYVGRGNLAARQAHLSQFLGGLTKLSEEFGVAVVLTNQGGGVTKAKDPAGGDIMSHSSTTRLYFQRASGSNRVCKIYDSPTLPESECKFLLTPNGIDDIPT